MRRKTKKEDILLPFEGIDYYKLYLQERDKRLSPFNVDKLFKDLMPEIKKDDDEEGLILPSRISDLGLDIPKPSELEKEYFQKFMESQKNYGSTLNRILNERYGKDFNEENYDHDEYIKDKELLNKYLKDK